ncbi:slit homolog 1 protein-like [Anneissia japonica]|uniref:slit homolog 1 protein-like n=1 Tax=Anneissia japonica TaxID=1529436 RepID=UPI0014257526|nr:slit homolog 1 protein-like [Anneissia japonica]
MELVRFIVVLYMFINTYAHPMWYQHNLFLVNTTSSPEILRCPPKCSCSYCLVSYNGTDVRYRHQVDCSRRKLTQIPDSNQLPTDAEIYFLQNNSIIELPNNSFRTTPNLTILDLSYNLLKSESIDRYAFKGLDKLQQLKLDGNQFTVLKGRWCQFLPSVEILSFQKCLIESVSRDVLDGCKNLKQIDFFDNDLNKIPDCHQNRKLKSINLKQNRVNYFLVKNLPTTIENIDLSMNWLHDLKHVSLENFAQHLKYFNLANNNFGNSRFIIEHLFNGSNVIEVLMLDNNNLYAIYKTWLIYFVMLTYFSISNSSISIIHEQSFVNCINLRFIDLSGNKITSLAPKLFQGLENLNSVYLQGNIITRLPEQAFYGSGLLENIIMADNNLTTINENVGLQKLKNLKQLDIQSNPWLCNCDLVWFRHWVNNTSVTISNLDALKCRASSNITIHLLKFDADSLHCLSPIISIAIPSCIVLLITITSVVIWYIFRWDFRYLYQRHLLRKQYQRLADGGLPPLDGVNIRFDVYVSYSHEDLDWVIHVLQPKLEGALHNFKLCLDYRDFTAGDTIFNNIIDSVKSSHKTLLIVTKSFIASEWCFFEVEMARTKMFDANEDSILIVLLEDVDVVHMPNFLRMLMQTKTYLKWPDEEEDRAKFWTTLAEVLKTPNAHKDWLINN